VHQGQTEGKGTTKKGSSIVTSTDCEPLTEQRRRELDHYLKLKRYGNTPHNGSHDYIIGASCLNSQSVKTIDVSQFVM